MILNKTICSRISYTIEGSLFFNFQRTEERYRFKSEKGLVIVCVALAVNYNTIYRIPSGVFAHGASYMVAYIILFVIFGYPLSFLDVVLGQYYTRGPYNVFKICPLFEGSKSFILLLHFFLMAFLQV